MSVSYDTFHEQIEPHLKIVRLGRRKIVPVNELQSWLDQNAERALGGTANDHRIERTRAPGLRAGGGPLRRLNGQR